jgi:hypothetical protein
MPPGGGGGLLGIAPADHLEQLAMGDDRLLSGAAGYVLPPHLHLRQPQANLVSQHVPAQQQPTIARGLDSPAMIACDN